MRCGSMHRREKGKESRVGRFVRRYAVIAWHTEPASFCIPVGCAATPNYRRTAAAEKIEGKNDFALNQMVVPENVQTGCEEKEKKW